MMVAPGELAEELARLAAAAGCEPSQVSDLDTLREQWSSAPLVLLDIAAASAASRAGLPRRDGVVIVCTNAEPDAWRCAVAVGAQQVAVLPDAEAWLVSALADVVDAPAQPGGRVLAVLGGRGGAGASVFAAAVAVAVADRDATPCCSTVTRSAVVWISPWGWRDSTVCAGRVFTSAAGGSRRRCCTPRCQPPCWPLRVG
jgi:secretion/DNA translocation related CpaE-like protein